MRRAMGGAAKGKGWDGSSGWAAAAEAPCQCEPRRAVLDFVGGDQSKERLLKVSQLGLTLQGRGTTVLVDKNEEP